MAWIYLSPPDINASDYRALEKGLDSNWVAPVGPQLAEFERAVCERIGRGAAVAVQSGTAALHLALQVIGVGRGDTVACPSLSFAASANPICYCGAEPVFVDSERRTWNMDPEALEALLDRLDREGRRPKAVVVVHLYGQCAAMEAIEAVCARFELPIVEDAAEALGARYRGRTAGSMGALSFLSFNGNKIITTSGGGMLLSDSVRWIDRARHLATQAREPKRHYEHQEVGYNYRMSNLLAGLGLSQLADLDRRIAVRKAHFEAYREALGDLPGVAFMPIPAESEPNYWLSCMTVDPAVAGRGRDAVIDALEARDIEARPLWKPLHLQPVYQACDCEGGACAARLFEDGLCLPSGSGMSEAARNRVIEAVRACFCG